MVSPIPERNNGEKNSAGASSKKDSFLSRLFPPSRPCCCRGCALKRCGGNCSSAVAEKQARPAPLGNASTNCMD